MKCGTGVDETAQFCTNCGGTEFTPIAEASDVTGRPIYGAPAANFNPASVEVSAQPKVVDKPNVGWCILGWLCPLFALIYFCVKKSEKPKGAKAVGICGLVSFIVNLIIVIVMWASLGAMLGGFVGGLSDSIDTEYYSSEDYDEDYYGDFTYDEDANGEAVTGETTTVAATGDYIDFDDMHFYINGVKYTLGKTTLQDMIDDGVPFDEDDLANASNNINSNYQMDFQIKLGDFWTASVYVLNDTDGNKPASECYINEIYYYASENETQNVLSFDFSTDITMDELKAACGEPDETDHYDGDNGYYTDTYEYTNESSRYYQDSSYEFEYTNGELSYITITYMP